MRRIVSAWKAWLPRHFTKASILLCVSVSFQAWGAYDTPTLGAVGAGATASSINLAYPSNCDAGDLVVAWFSHRAAETVGVPSGYILANPSATNRNELFIKEATGSEDGGSLAISITTPTEDRYVGQVACFPTGATGYDVSALIDASNSVFTGDGTVDIPTPTLTVADDNSLIITAGFKRQEDITYSGMPTSHTEIGQGGTSTFSHFAVWARWIQTTATNISASTFDTASSSTAQSRSVVLALKAPVTPSSGEFDVNPTVTGVSTTAFTVAGSLASSGTVSGVACLKDQTAPTGSQVAAADCTGDVDAQASDSDTPSDDFTLTLTPSDDPPFPVYDLYFWDGTTLVTLADQFLAPPSTCGEGSDEQCQAVLLTSIGSESPCAAFNADDAGDPDIAAGDVLLAPITVQPSGLALSVFDDCEFEYSPGAGDPSATERQSALNVAIYDTTAESFHDEDIDPYVNNKLPDCVEGFVRNFRVNQAATIDIAALCPDEDDPSSVFVVAEDTDPSLTGMTFSDPDYAGTPTVVGESGTGEYTVVDGPGDSDALTVEFSVLPPNSGGAGTRLRSMRMRGL